MKIKNNHIGPISLLLTLLTEAQTIKLNYIFAIGKRKSRKVVRKKPAPKLEKDFDCPFCCRSSSITVKMYDIH